MRRRTQSPKQRAAKQGPAPADGVASGVIRNSLDAGIAVLGPSGTIVATNNIWNDFVSSGGCTPAASGGVGEDGLAFCASLLGAAPEGAAGIVMAIESVLSRAESGFEAEYRSRLAGVEKWFLVKVTPLADGQPGAVVVHVDITEHKRIEQALLDQARHDPLTGTLNHRAIAETLASHVAGSHDQHVAVALIEVDCMTAINDTYGHDVGDAVLLAVARAAATPGATVGRYGGDQFVVILEEGTRSVAARYKNALIESVAAIDIRDHGSGSRVPVSISAGLAVYPGDARETNELLRLAGAAMYSSRGQVRTRRSTFALAGSGDRAAAVLREIMFLLTASGDLPEKLRLVAHRLSAGAGYDFVSIELFGAPPDVEESVLWGRLRHDMEVLQDAFLQAGAAAFRPALEHLHREISVDDLPRDERLTAEQRATFAAASLHSALFVPVLEDGRLIGALAVASYEQAAFTVWDSMFLRTVATQIAAIARMSLLVAGLSAAAAAARQAHEETVLMLAATAEAHDRTTGLHLRNVQALTGALARELGYEDEVTAEIGLAAVLHDIGKIRVPKQILLSPDKLSETEWSVVKQHTIWGGEFLVGRDAYKLAAQVALHHHEHWDGSGYPSGLAAHEIPEEATIVAVADAFDAMTHDRPYRLAISVDKAVERIVAGAGTQFSPAVVAALVRLYQRDQIEVKYDERARIAA